MTYTDHLLQRLAHLSRQIIPFMQMPWEDMDKVHEATGLANWQVYVLLIEAIGWTVHELSEQEVSA